MVFEKAVVLHHAKFRSPIEHEDPAAYHLRLVVLLVIVPGEDKEKNGKKLRSRETLVRQKSTHL